MLSDFRRWARTADPDDPIPGGGESRAVVVRRYVRGFRTVLARRERHVLVVAHSLPIRYVINAADEEDPAPTVELVEYAEPYRLDGDELRGAVDRLEAWCSAPTWKLPT